MKKNNYNQPRQLSFFTATCVVIATMIGTGIFTTTGFLAADLGNASVILLVWLLGGLIAICGALTYGELAACMPRSGGEYHYLSRIYHPVAGFLSGWVSLVVGFSAPIAAASVAFGKYLTAVYPSISALYAALLLVIILSMLHISDVKIGSYFQNSFTVLKIVIILLFIISGLWWCQVETPDTTLFPLPSTYGKGLGVRWDLVMSPAFAVALIFVSFSYSGWNAAAYLGGEIKDPGRNLPRALILGTTIVIILYLGLNFVFINTVPFSDLAGKVEVGSLSAQAIFGEKGGTFMGLAISLILVSSVSAMIMTGPRIYQALGEDFSFYRILAVKTKRNAPLAAVLLQMSIAILLIVTTTFESLLYFIGFTLSIITFSTVLGIYIHRHKYPNVKRPYRTLGYPVTPAIYLLLSIWMVVHTIIEKPVVSLAGFGTLLVGLLIYYLTVGKITVKHI